MLAHAADDLYFDPTSLEKVTLYNCSSNSKNNNKQYCHSGIYTRTMWIYNDIQEHNLLQYVIDKMFHRHALQYNYRH